jgi:hypothetical protein
MDKRPLWLYVIGVVIALAAVNYLAWLTGGAAKLYTSELVSVGFLLGLLAMYIAVHPVNRKILLAVCGK